METKFNNKYHHYQTGRLPHHPDVLTYFQQHYAAAGTVLELGAGTGIGTIMLSEFFHQVIAVEPITEMLNYGKDSIENNNVTFLNSDVESLDVNKLNFNYLICFQATHWFYDTPMYQASYQKATKPVIDVCSNVFFPNDQSFFDDLIQKYTIAQSHRGTPYPYKSIQDYTRQETISTELAAHHLCSRSWFDHTCFPQVKAQIAKKFGHDKIVVDVKTQVYTIS